MAETFENKQIDKRVVHRYIRKGVVDEKDYQAHLKALVGDARYEEYQRANDYRFRQIYEFARRQGLPAETAEQWYQLEREMGRQAAALRGDKTLTADARAQALDQLRDQLRASASPYLGTNTGTFFERNGMRF